MKMKKQRALMTIFSIFFLFSSSLLHAKKLNVLVQPFQNAGARDYAWLSTGMTDTVISDLYKIKGLNVISEEDRLKALKEMELGQTGIMKDATMVKIGNLTGANLIFTGSYQVSGENIRVNARIIEVPGGKIRKAIKVDGTLKNLFEIQDQLTLGLLAESEKIKLAAIKTLKVPENEKKEILSKYRPKLSAYEWYAKGLGTRDFNPQEALEYFKEAVKVDSAYVAALIKAGYTAGRQLNRFDEADSYLAKAKLILRKNNKQQSFEYAHLLMIYGIISNIKGDWESANNYYLESKRLLEKLSYSGQANYAALLMNLGQHHGNVGKMDQALDYYFKSRDLLDELGRQNSGLYAALLNNIGILFDLKGRFDRSLEFYFQSLKIKEKLGLKSSVDYAMTLINIGQSYFNQGQSKKALDYYQKGRELIEKRGLLKISEYASALMNIGIIYSERGKEDEALKYYHKAERIYQELNLANTKSYSSLLMNFGTTYRGLGKLDQAIDYYLKSKRLKEKLNLTNTSGYGHILLNLAASYQTKKDTKKACAYFRDAYQAYKRAGYKGKLKKAALKYARKCR
jgi:tetratricopeptide (TPR) repeat protein